MYYLYTPGMKQSAVTIYEAEEEALRVRDMFNEYGIEAHVCEFGYPFA